MICDILIIGTGISGCTAAWYAAELGYKVLIVSKEENPLMTNTYYAQGGIVGDVEEDSPSLLAKDIISAGGGISNPYSVNILSTFGPPMVTEFFVKQLKVPFTLKDGKPDITAEGAHSIRRIFHSADYTGKAIQETLFSALKEHPNISILSHYMAVDLITNTHHSKDHVEKYRQTRCFGAYFLNCSDNTVIKVLAHRVILATGGLGHVFLHTSNPSGATGDGLAMAYRAGVSEINSEFVQFHPTTLYLADSDERFLISESVRGEGAKLINKFGEAFMHRYHEDLELASRDIVSRAIFYEMVATNSPCAYLDLSAMKDKFDIEQRFPQIYKKCKAQGIDMSKQPVPVVPAAHYFCGGVKVDEFGRTAIRGLHAAGECACTGVHGANRLASTSLLEGMLWGRKSVEFIHENFQQVDHSRFNSIPEWKQPEINESDPLLIKNDIKNIRTLMWNYVGIVRNKNRLKRAKVELSDLFLTIEDFYRGNSLSRELLELRNMVTVARIIASSAYRNEHSLGCHFIENS